MEVRTASALLEPSVGAHFTSSLPKSTHLSHFRQAEVSNRHPSPEATHQEAHRGQFQHFLVSCTPQHLQAPESHLTLVSAPSKSGSESSAGRRSSPVSSRAESGSLLSARERLLLAGLSSSGGVSLSGGEYVAVKLGVVREWAGRRAGAPYRPNVRSDTRTAKAAVARFAASHRWLPF